MNGALSALVGMKKMMLKKNVLQPLRLINYFISKSSLRECGGVRDNVFTVRKGNDRVPREKNLRKNGTSGPYNKAQTLNLF